MNTLSAILWNPDIEIFSIFGISIRYYSVLFVTGLSLAYWVIYKLYQDQKIPYEKFDSLFVYCLLGIVIGARLGHCLFYEPGYWLSHPVYCSGRKAVCSCENLLYVFVVRIQLVVSLLV